MHWGRIAAGVVVLGGIIAGGYAWVHREKVFWADLDKEVQAQKAEIPACRARLAQLYKAWAAYRKDHKGAMPGSFEALYPRYITDARLYVCPTAERLLKRRAVSRGTVKLGGKEYPETYYFRWLTSGYHLATKRLGDRAPLIVCVSHREGTYGAAYHHSAKLADFDPDARASLVEPVQQAPVLAVRTNGVVEELKPAEQSAPGLEGGAPSPCGRGVPPRVLVMEGGAPSPPSRSQGARRDGG